MDGDSLKEARQVSPVPIYAVPWPREDEEIDVWDLWNAIVKQKVTIFLGMVVAVALASLYLYLAEPVFRAEMKLLPPRNEDIQELLPAYRGLDIRDSELYSREFVYKEFLRNLTSLNLQRQFFDSRNLIANYVPERSNSNKDFERIFVERFSKSWRFQPDKNDPQLVTVSFGYSDPGLAAEWLDAFVTFANEHTVRQLSSDVRGTVQAAVDRLRHQLASKLELAEQRRLDQIVQLREALHIADALGIESGSIASATSEQPPPGSVVSVNTADEPLYMRGSKALKLEISVLEARKLDEPFVAGLRDLQESLAYLEGIQIDADSIKALTVDADARAPYYAEKPRKTLVLALAITLGLFLGLSVALVRGTRSKLRGTSYQVVTEQSDPGSS